MAKITKLVLDVLKPSERCPSADLVAALADLEGTDTVDLTVEEVDKKVETISLIIEGTNLDLDMIQRTIAESGASLHSIDKIKASTSR